MTISANYPSIRPTLLLDFANGEALDPRITFSRPTTGTYYDGKTSAIAEQNLVLQSQTFDNASWTKALVNVTANSVAAPDSTTTADSIIPNASSGYHNILQNISISSTSAYTLSVYAKAGGYNYVQVLAIQSGGSNYVEGIFNLSTGAIEATGRTLNWTGSRTIESVGNGWYRCTVTVNSIPSGITLAPQFGVLNTNDPVLTFAGDTTSGIYLWGAQLEQRSTVTAYQVTTTAPVTNYIPVLLTAPANAPRFQHNPTTGESLGLLIEEQRTNLWTYSDDFANAAWTATATSVSSNTAIAPDGTLTADKIVENTANTSHIIGRTSGAVAANGVSHTITVYAKASNRNWIIVAPVFTANAAAWFNISAGTVGTIQANATAATITSVGNGWFRCSVTCVGTGNPSNSIIYLADANNSVSYAGNGFDGVFLWGAQIEVGAFPTSYVPTVASQVTRSADNPLMTGTNFSSWYNQAQGTMFISYSFAFPTVLSNRGVYSLNNGTSSNRLDLRSSANANNSSNGVPLNSPTINGQTYNLTQNKTAISYFVTSSFYSNNTGNSGSFSLSTMPAVTQLQIGNLDGNTIAALCGNISKIAYYPIALTNTNLIALTGS